MKKLCYSLLILISAFFAACSRSESIESINENQLFTVPYGNFEEQLSVKDLNGVGGIRYGIFMRDGFFYIVNGDSKKIMELNSYGDLLTIYYNEESEISELLDNSKRNAQSVHNKIAYPFDYAGMISVDSKKNIYAVCSVPRDRQEQSDDETMLYSQTVLRIARDGSSVEYIGQQGPGGTPFPFIKNIYTTEKDELVVVGTSTQGAVVYWFATDGFLKYKIPISEKSLPKINSGDEAAEYFVTIDNVIPDPTSYLLYVKVDYYSTYIDEESKVQSGINYLQTLLYPLNIEKSTFEEPVSIPPYEESVLADYSRLTYKIPYDFLGVTKSGWKFFIIKNDDGFTIQMLQSESQKILRRHFTAAHNNILFDFMSLSSNGILTAIYLEKESARVVWYRTDSLIESILKN